MTRFESSGQINREELKQEIKNELQHDERKRKLHRFFILVGVTLVLIAVPIILCMFLCVKSGFMKLPMLSDWFYSPVNPSRIVNPLSGTNAITIMNGAIVRSQFSPSVGSLKLSLTEQELTTIINSVLNQNRGSLPISISSLQIVLDQGVIEIYALTERSQGIKIPILIRLIPSIQAGKLQISSERLTVGALNIPNFITSPVVRLLANKLTDGVNQVLSSGGKLENIKIISGKIELILSRSR